VVNIFRKLCLIFSGSSTVQKQTFQLKLGDCLIRYEHGVKLSMCVYRGGRPRFIVPRKHEATMAKLNEEGLV
jgi:hypothetical protein